MSTIAEPHSAGDHAHGASTDAGAAHDPVGGSHQVDRGPSGVVLLAWCLPAVVVGLLIRTWVLRSSLLTLNSDESITGLQGFEILHGRFRLMVAGNDYGSTTESYLVAPLLTFWSGPGPLRFMVVVLSMIAAYALYLLARPFYGRTVAATVALVGWTTSGAMVLMWLHPYMGYPSGAIAEIVALALACQAMRTRNKLPWISLGAGFAAGFAIWSHPVFGVVSLLALLAPCCYRWRDLRQWWLPLAAGGLLGVSPWLIYAARHGLPRSATAAVQTIYPERVLRFFTELLPRAFGLRSVGGAWIGPDWLAIGAAAVLILGAIGGWVLLARRTGRESLPIVVAGTLAFPVLAFFNQLAYASDARYALPFMPPLLMGLAAWSLLLPSRVQQAPWVVVAVPIVWVLALCVPVINHHVDLRLADPDRDAYAVLNELQDRQIHYLAGNYWGVYLVDYLADGSLVARPDHSLRFDDQAQQVTDADPTDVAYVYGKGMKPALALPIEQYQRIELRSFELYVPKRTTG